MKILKIFILLFVFYGVSNGKPCESHYTELKAIAMGMGFIVTSEMGGGHNAHSRHYRGKAVDVRSRGKSDFQIDMLRLIVEQNGYEFRDERIRPKGQRVWKGPHIHLAIPYCSL